MSFLFMTWVPFSILLYIVPKLYINVESSPTNTSIDPTTYRRYTAYILRFSTVKM